PSGLRPTEESRFCYPAERSYGPTARRGSVPDDRVCWLSALELRDAFRRRELSPVEVTEAILARIDRINPSLNAYVTVTPALAVDQARAAEKAYAAGEAGPLAGIPISIKDLTPTRGVRTARGSLMDPD